MEQILDYITSLNWADNWISYLIAGGLIGFLGYLVIKLILNKIKQLFILALIVASFSLLTYVLFLAGITQFDVLTLVGLGEISQAIQGFFTGVQDWFKDVFNLGVAIKFIK